MHSIGDGLLKHVNGQGNFYSAHSRRKEGIFLKAEDYAVVLKIERLVVAENGSIILILELIQIAVFGNCLLKDLVQARKFRRSRGFKTDLLPQVVKGDSLAGGGV